MSVPDWSDLHHRQQCGSGDGISHTSDFDIRHLSTTSPDWAQAHQDAHHVTLNAPQFELSPGAFLFLSKSRQRTNSVICRGDPIRVVCVRKDGSTEDVHVQVEAHVVNCRTWSGAVNQFAHWVVYMTDDYVHDAYVSHLMMKIQPLAEEPPYMTKERFRCILGISPITKNVMHSLIHLSKDDAELHRDGVIESHLATYRNQLLRNVMSTSFLPDL